MTARRWPVPLYSYNKFYSLVILIILPRLASAPRSVSQHTRLANHLCRFFKCPKWKCHLPPYFLLRASLWEDVILHLQPDGTHLVYAPPQCQISIGGGASSRGLPLISSRPVSTSELDGRFVIWIVNPLDTALTWGLIERLPSIPCAFFHIVAPHHILNATSGQLTNTSSSCSCK